jgi:hypothetical protein
MDKTYIWAADVGSAQLPERLSPLRKRALEIADLFANDTSVWHRIFAPSLIETVPVPQLKGIFASYYEKLGAGTQLRQLESNEASAFSGRFELIFERNHAAGLFLTVHRTGDSGAPLRQILQVRRRRRLQSGRSGTRPGERSHE